MPYFGIKFHVTSIFRVLLDLLIYIDMSNFNYLCLGILEVCRTRCEHDWEIMISQFSWEFDTLELIISDTV